jgi:hypothetical protein
MPAPQKKLVKRVTSDPNQPTTEQWQQLCALMDQIKRLQPWSLLLEDMYVGFRHPITEQEGIISIMGMAGEHIAVAVYLEREAINRLHLLRLGLGNGVEVVELRHLQASFEDYGFMERQDLEVLRRLGLRYSGANAWPKFRSFQPGALPWYIDKDEADLLIHALTQTVVVAERAHREGIQFITAPLEQEHYHLFFRLPQQEADGTISWHDEVVPHDRDIWPHIVFNHDDETTSLLKQLPVLENTLLLDFTLLPNPVKEPRERPKFPFLLLVVEQDSERILASQMMSISPDLPYEQLIADIPVVVAQILLKEGLHPSHLVVDGWRMYLALGQLSHALGAELELSSASNSPLSRVRDHLLHHMKSRRM